MVRSKNWFAPARSILTPASLMPPILAIFGVSWFEREGEGKFGVDHGVCLRQLTLRSCVLDPPQYRVNPILGQVWDQIFKTGQQIDLVACGQELPSDNETKPEFVAANEDAHLTSSIAYTRYLCDSLDSRPSNVATAQFVDCEPRYAGR